MTVDQTANDLAMIKQLRADASWIALPYPHECLRMRETADRMNEMSLLLGELDGAVSMWRQEATELKRLDTLRPPCPTCGGKGVTGGGLDEFHQTICPDCEDGKAPMERMVSVFIAVFDKGNETASTDPGAVGASKAIFDRLRRGYQEPWSM